MQNTFTNWFRCFLAVIFVAASASIARAQQAMGQTEAAEKPRVLILATRHVRETKLRLLTKLATEHGRFEVEYKFSKNIDKDASLRDLVAPYSLVIFDGVTAKETHDKFGQFASVVDQQRIFLPIKEVNPSTLRSGINLAQAKTLYDYYYNGGKKNLTRLVGYLDYAILQLGGSAPLSPIVFSDSGFYHPDYPQVVFPSFDAYLQWVKTPPTAHTPVIGIAITRESIAAGDTVVVDQLVADITKRGGFAAAYYHNSRSQTAQVELLQKNEKTLVDVIINTRVIHWAAKRGQEFAKLGVPILQAIPYNAGTQADWEAYAGGIPSMTTPFYLTLPEIAGAIDPVIASAKNEQGAVVPIDYQIQMTLDRAFAHANLVHTANSKKKIALMFYNYPPGEKSAGASFLNVPKSIDQILERLGSEGYLVEDHDPDWFIERVGQMLAPFYRDQPMTKLSGIGEATGNAGLLPVARYRAWFDQLPDHVRQPINAIWGKPEEAFTVAKINGEAQFIIPRIISGNVTILPQPPRGSRAKAEKSLFHDKANPVSHSYLAVYFYAREQFGADALIHLGTHGSQEWLPGKERGLSRYDAGNLALGSIPVIYPFIMDDVGEAIQAKRRGRAIMISHLTPPMSQSGLYAEISELHDLMHQYDLLEQGAVRKKTQDRIVSTVVERNLHDDVSWTQQQIEQDFESFLVVLHDWLGVLGAEIQPLGLHTFGGLPKNEYMASTLVQMLGKDYAERAQKHGSRYLDPLAHDETVPHSHSHDETVPHSHSKNGESELGVQDHTDFTRLQETPSYRLMNQYVMGEADLADIRQKDLRADLQLATEYLQGFRDTREFQSLIDALGGRFVPPTIGGDPVRHPEALPSGGNLYGFDPSKMPTRSAWEAGQQLTKTMIFDYHAEHGLFPDKLTYSLWAIEAMRHLGVIESQAMAAIGVRPVWNEQGYVTDVEVIPYSELKRPRVDVVLSITGLYRDALPNLVQLLAKAVDKVAALEEDNNYVRINALSLRDELIEGGMEPEQAAAISTLRVFSNETGTYGTGLADATLSSGQWEGDDRLAQMYLSRMGYAYGASDQVWSQDLRDINLYAKNLSGTDAAVFSRTSNVYGLLTSDDPFQYMGGISMAVRYLDGASPKMFISNLRDADNMRSETLGQFLSKELRTRQFHPQWISAMQEEGYSGTLAMLDSLNNFWGWQVMDPQNVRADQWQEFFEVYVQDKYDLNMDEFFEQANPHALAQMIERMLESVRKEYWDADEAVIAEMMQKYIELANQFDVVTSNAKFTEFVGAKSAGYGLDPLMAGGATPAMADPVQVQGQKLEQVKPPAPSEQDYTWILLSLIILLPFLFGIIHQFGFRANRQLVRTPQLG